MMAILTEKYRGIHVMGCGDCPFVNRDEDACQLMRVVADDPASAGIALEHDMKTLPSWCPLRGGPISVSAEPGSVAS